MSDAPGSVRSQVIHLEAERSRIPGPPREHAVVALHRGTLDVALSIPRRPVHQTPHEQDEVYIVVQGSGVFFHDGKRDRFEAGDFLFVAAGVEHQFEDFTDDLTVWRVFFGARGGELPG